MKMNKLRFLFAVLVILIVIITNCKCETVPEDLLTDNDEQLYKLQRDDLIDSFMKRISPRTSKQLDGKAETHESPRKKLNQVKDAEENASLYLKSIIPSPSRFSSAYVDTIQIYASKNVSNSSNDTGDIANRTIYESISSTPGLQRSFSMRQSHTPGNIEKSSSSFYRNISATYSSSVTTANGTLALLHSQLFVSTMLTSTKSLLVSAFLTPNSISVRYDTAQPIIQPSSTIFTGDQLPQSSSISETSKIVNPHTTFSANTKTAPPISLEEKSRKMPSIPDEIGYGGFIPTTLKNEKGISFIYINILLPIVAGITGALFITFSILLFRCCRRRKLKKVRYFGAKSKRDIVHLDQMNLLTDTSDEDDFD